MAGSDPLFFVIDQGTQSTRAMLFDQAGTLVAKEQLPIVPYLPGKPGGVAEQTADYFWECITQASRTLWQHHSDLKSRVVGMTVATQRASVVCLDDNKTPLRPAVIWLDQRRAQNVPKVPWWLKTGAILSGQWRILRQFQTKAECNWLAEQEPENWHKTRHFVLLSAYLNHRLTGRLCDSVASQVGYLPFDYKKQQWYGPKHWIWQALRLHPSQMPELVQAGEKIGELTDEAAEAMALPKNLPLYATGADKACEILGAGAIHKEVANISYGTTATLNTTHKRYVTPQPLLPAYPAIIPKHYTAEVAVQRGYWMVNWFKEQFAHEETQRAKALKLPAEALFETFLHSTESGANGLILQPFWNPGVRYPGPEAKGAIIGFDDSHTKAHLYRAIVEGIAYALFVGASTLEHRQKSPIKELRITGGGSQSDAIMQITADVFGLPAVRIHTQEATGLGAAMSLALSTGVYANHEQAVQAMCHQQEVFYPDSRTHAQYQHIINTIYAPMYKRLKPLYQQMQKL